MKNVLLQGMQALKQHLMGDKMSLLDRLSNLVKKDKSTAEDTREISAEQELQTIFNDPKRLYKLCSVLTAEDQLKFFSQCEAIKSGKVKLDQLTSSMKASDLLSSAQKSEESSERKNNRLEKLAEMNANIKALMQKSFTDTNLKSKLLEDNKKFRSELSFHQLHSKTESAVAWGVLMMGIASGRIKDISQVQQLSVDARVDYQKKKRELGLIVSPQTTSAQKRNESR